MQTETGLSLSELKRRGWSLAMIAGMLGQPDELIDNPHFPGGSKVKIYRTVRVVAAEASERFSMAMEARRVRGGSD